MVHMKEAVEAVGVTVGKKTKRERLLELLKKHITKKRPRISQQRRVASTSTSAPVIDEPLQDCNANTTTNFSIYDDLALSKMLKDVGLDTKGFDWDALVHTCKMYEELSKSEITDVKFHQSETDVALNAVILPKFTLDLRQNNTSEERGETCDVFIR